MTESSKQSPQTTIPLKDPALAAFLAWLVPGLGHLYQGRTAKAVLYFVCLTGTFAYGCYLGGSRELGWGRVVYMAWREDDARLPYVCQVGIGLPALPALVQANRARNQKDLDGGLLWGGFEAPPLAAIPAEEKTADRERARQFQAQRAQRHQFTLDEICKSRGWYFELGTVYTMIAGLLNILAIYDAWGGPIPPEPKKEDDDEDQKADAGGKEDSTPAKSG